ncbi:MAG: UDP-N-acetylmuramoyl-L-alanine--D-glutamate ligase [Gammaproteobacteria bacterium]|nr:UDP-N-acetylmuramoyl-L-alanine--D-glutamate ligase [Gammaproteobacteria bacterium]MDH5660133.1 UDP-N-acetylmuramoyl-L-alanine--D-glutamate ligase [Gammaproteobacteria bacterium]
MLAEKVQNEGNEIENMDTLSHKRILVVGLGKTGLSCARYLSEQGIEVAITDSRVHPPALDELQKTYPDIAVFVGGFNSEAFERATCLIVSPGISLREPLISEARARGTEIIGDIELFARNANAPVVAITGSNGKSTVTTLLGEMAKTAGLDVRVGGNIGVPALDLLYEPRPDLYVLELSSFQLETTDNLNACAAAILNISEDHMDRYHDLNDYTAAKAKVYYGTGTLIVNLDDERVMATANLVRQGRSLLGFTASKPKDNQFGICSQSDNEDYLCYGNKLLLPVSELKIKGQHNVVNALAAIALGQEANIPLDAMIATLREFPGLPHRSQWIAEKNGVTWYNDSKATNVGAAIAAINGIEANNIILIAGGQGKGQDFSPLKDAVKNKVKHLIVLGEDADLLSRELSGCTEISKVNDLSEAVKKANEIAVDGDAVLLSPACASFDMFSGFEQRGELFVAAVLEVLQ